MRLVRCGKHAKGVLINRNTKGKLVLYRIQSHTQRKQAMVGQRKGKIVNISSCSGKKPTLEEGAYCSSKSAVIGLTRVTALELSDHMTGESLIVFCR